MHLVDQGASETVQLLIHEGFQFQLEYKHIQGFADWGAVFWTGVGDPPDECWAYGETAEEAIFTAAQLVRGNA